jgi:hypothetical protein
MAFFNSYVSLPEGTPDTNIFGLLFLPGAFASAAFLNRKLAENLANNG